MVESSADSSWSERAKWTLEPVPRWPIAVRSWQLAWEMHVYVFGVTFCAVAFSALLNLLRVVRCRRLPYAVYFGLIDIVAFVCGASRGIFLLVDPYSINGTLNTLVSTTIYCTVFPLTVFTFAILFVVLLRATGVQLCLFYNVSLVTVISLINIILTLLAFLALSHCSLPLATILHLAFRLTSLAWATLVFTVYLGTSWRLYSAARRKWRQALSRFSPCHFIKSEATNERLMPLNLTLFAMVRFAIIAAILGLLVTALLLYGMFGILKPLTTINPEPWPWWILQTATRLCELISLTTVLHAANLPVRQYNFNMFTDNSRQNCNCCCCCCWMNKRGRKVRRTSGCCVTCCDNNCGENEDRHDEWYMMSSPDYFSKSTLQLHVRADGGGECCGSSCALNKSASLFSTNKSASTISTTKCNNVVITPNRSGSVPSGFASLVSKSTLPDPLFTSDKSRPQISMLTFENGLLRFRQDGDPDDQLTTGDDISLGHYPASLATDRLSSNASVVNRSHGASPSDASICTDWMGAMWSGHYRRPLPAMKTRRRSNSVSGFPSTSLHSSEGASWAIDNEKLSAIFNFQPPSDMNLQDSIDKALNSAFSAFTLDNIHANNSVIKVNLNEHSDSPTDESCDTNLIESRRRSNSCSSQQSTRSYWWKIHKRPRDSKRWKRNQLR